MNKKLRELQAKKAAAAQAKADNLKAAGALLDKSGAENRDLTGDEQVQFDGFKAAADASTREIERIQSQIDVEQELALATAQAQGIVMVDGSAYGDLQVRDNVLDDPRRGFKSKGDFFKSVYGAAQARSTGHAIDQRLLIGASAPALYNNEGSGADGAFAIPPEFSKEIWTLSLDEGSLLPMTANTEVSSNSMMFPKDETTPWGGNGAQAYWKGEASAANPSKLQLGAEMLRLKELMVLVPITNELLADAPALGSYITPIAASRIQWKTNEAILFGTGGAQPLGCMSGNALIVVPKVSGQATGTIVQQNISSMRSRLVTGNLKNAIWAGNPDILPALESLVVGQIPIFLPPGTGIRAGYDGTLNGRPLILTEHANALGAQSDLSLIALNGYRTITKAEGIETATSMHLYFDANATAFRFIFRIDGQPIIAAPIQPPTGKSPNTRSYFVTLAARP